MTTSTVTGVEKRQAYVSVKQSGLKATIVTDSPGKVKIKAANKKTKKLKKYYTIKNKVIKFKKSAKKTTYKFKVTVKASGNYLKTTKKLTISVT